MRKHNFVDNHPILSSFLICMFMLLFQELLATLLRSVHIMLFKEVSKLSEIIYMFISAALSFLFYKLWFNPDFEGALTGGNLKDSLKYYLPFVIYWIITAVAMLIEHSFRFKGITPEILRVSLTAGIVEELCFRHATVSTILKNRNQKDQLLKIVFISSVFFGLLHLTNLVGGADPFSTILQILTASCLGIYFAVLYVRCGNLLPAIILHSLHDIYAISTSSEVTEQGLIAGGVTFSSYVDLFCCIALAIYAIKYLLPEQGKEKVVALWNHKWNKDSTKLQ